MALAGPGFSSPVHVVTTRPPGTLPQRLAAVPGVVSVAAPVRSSDGSHWLVDARIAAQAESSPARAIVGRIRAVAGPDALVGGSTVFDQNVEQAIFGGIWKMLLFILGASYLVLLVLLRSVAAPAEGRARQPAQRRGGVRRARRHLPVGLVRLDGLHVARLRGHDRAGARARGDVRALDGLRGVPADADPRALARARRQRAGGLRGARPLGADDHERGRRDGGRVRVLLGRRLARAEGARRSASPWRSCSTRRSSASSSCPSAMRLLGTWNWWFPGAPRRVLPPAPSGPPLTFPACGSSSPAAPASSARTSSSGCSAPARTSSCSTS